MAPEMVRAEQDLKTGAVSIEEGYPPEKGYGSEVGYSYGCRAADWLSTDESLCFSWLPPLTLLLVWAFSHRVCDPFEYGSWLIRLEVGSAGPVLVNSPILNGRPQLF
jgi:hypothetical protein